ncbi:hypothetical protein CSTERLE_06455 [Thermoclostridium stercorarium subsp. leptospartum DSM 9219]|jgi:hypothetical protein|uniref:Uncharacterized protein n=1 Tax=Thermoclostridium stercorarium subsp. leptospartum DSM 9219 TaxID=1346611 RepID=A0A1B1YKH5_THEST|nr:hypothetical protein [Thermoclostridium stercorarium]ANX01234.1 hypothetical protein CSTERLE_06455 [Thermoclostridium stercorarium subsp. leptospartum DSM 9219]
MENSLKAIIIGAGVVITMAVVSIGIILMRSGQSTALATIGKLERINSELEESQYTIYDGMELSGSEVVNVIRRFKDEYIGVMVKTNKNPSGTWYINEVVISNNTGEIKKNGTVSNISELMDEASDKYINRNGKFTGEVIRDKNGKIVALIFTQK